MPSKREKAVNDLKERVLVEPSRAEVGDAVRKAKEFVGKIKRAIGQ